MDYAIVTPSHGPDYERCALLCRSINRWVTGDFRHYLIVDQRDFDQFHGLADSRTRVMTVESVMPWWLIRLPFAKRWWLSLKTPPVRNWVLQQLVKLSVAEFLDADAYMFVDSDVVFVRPFEMSSLRDETTGKLRLFRVPGAAQLPTHFRWHRSSAHLLGLPPQDYFGSTYIGNLITWDQTTLKALYRQIESVHKRSWLRTVASQWHLSEYILYGIFAEHVLGAKSNHFDTDQPLCHISWDYQLDTDESIERFFEEIWPNHVAVMVSSKQNIDVSRYRHLVEPEAGSPPSPQDAKPKLSLTGGPAR